MQKKAISNSLTVKCLPALPVTYLHYHSSLELGVCLEGSGVFYIGSQTFSFSQGDVSIIFPNIIHIAQSAQEKGSKWRFITVDLPPIIDNSKISTPVEGGRGGCGRGS